MVSCCSGVVGFLLPLETVGQLGAAQAQHACRTCQIAAAALDRQREDACLEGLDRHAGFEHLLAQANLFLRRARCQPALRIKAGMGRVGLVGKQVLGLNHAALCCQDHTALNQVLQLTHVARPVVVRERLQRTVAEATQAFLVQGRKARQQVLRQRFDVAGALAQGRNGARPRRRGWAG